MMIKMVGVTYLMTHSHRALERNDGSSAARLSASLAD
jgi:hypothetical protein